ncbi:hypothetical protein SAMN05892883_2193 [Jatrophihabitans sp. GAS493]|uniref:hypothetical protein n=1 Tax=Jatrophihabitans sp. GAS493 TaxID=1907575 RepID=UPI000BB790AA|nr:hypothetical protein [Jatrophihabitans sp. GAS493]SOD72872.1 hypothetical protein SAMN05892883_2193 [Jatrophihabitans sp. GAS493]
MSRPADRYCCSAEHPPTYERRGALLRQHDSQVCDCGHRCISHGSYDHRRAFIGVGLGPCGWPRCDCDQFLSSGTSSDTGNTPVPDYDRETSDEQINTICDDCQAPPGEPCHWACSSWWA